MATVVYVYAVVVITEYVHVILLLRNTVVAMQSVIKSSPTLLNSNGDRRGESKASQLVTAPAMF